jgi:D-alanine-D-alanine ligase-like ATP-grasp enzyme
VKKLRILALVHDHLVPPEDTTGIDILEAEWKMEYDVIETLREIGHDVRVLGINDNLGGIRPTVGLFKPHIVFNLMEAFAGVTTFDQNVVSYLELLGLPYTGCNPRGLILARDKALYVGVIGNERLDVLAPWEMSFAQMPDNRWKIATERVKWSTQYQKKHGIMTDRARLDAGTVERMQRMAKRAYRALDLSGYARIDIRMDEEQRIYVLEANPNPNMAYGEDFSESAEAQGISYERLLDRLIALGLRWKPARTG